MALLPPPLLFPGAAFLRGPFPLALSPAAQPLAISPATEPLAQLASIPQPEP